MQPGLFQSSRETLMATSEKSKAREGGSVDLLAVIRSSGILGEKPFSDLKSKVVRGDYPRDPVALAECLVQEGILTAYQTRRFLSNKAHGLLIGRYVILDRVGSGSMGRVFKAHHMMMDRVVALKIIAPEISSNQRVAARFQREMKLVGRLDHPNVVRAYDADQLNNILYIVMEYVQGQSLGQRLRQGPIAPLEMIDYAAQAALGLAHAHEQGIVHRDVKPSNILLADDRRVKILDLGLGVLMEADASATFATADGIAVGTVDYMSPEQACGRDVDGRSDLFSLGCSTYHLLTGKLPFPGESPIERLGKRISGRHTPITEHLPDLPSSVVQVLDRLMAPKPHERYANAAEAAKALQGLIRPRSRANHGSPASVGGPGPTAPKPAGPDSAAAKSTTPPKPAAPTVVKVQPSYPRWFAPAAKLAETRPVSLLLCLIATLSLTFAAGIGLGWFLR
jgi:serine/threonine-protein kinase